MARAMKSTEMTIPAADGGLDASFAASYQMLRSLAESFTLRFAASGTLQATALVHEAYIKLSESQFAFVDQAHCLRTAAMAMRQILVDHARTRNCQKRGGEYVHVTLDDSELSPSANVDVLVLNDALARLEAWDEQQARIVELRCFLGLSLEETAENLRISLSTVKRDWAMARAWLQHELTAP